MTAVTFQVTLSMHEFFRTVNAAAALFLASSCGATTVPRESPPEDGESTLPTPAQPAAEANEVGGDSEPASEAQPDTVEHQGSGERNVQAMTDSNPASDARAESAWSPETAQTIVERARRKLKRRCDAGSQAACGAIPNLDKCINLQRASCVRLGDLFARGAAGVARNPAHARDFWWRACDIASADCLRYGKLLFDIEGLESRQIVADRFFRFGCTNDFQLCERVGRFYQQRNELAAARKFFDLGCSAGQNAACQAKK
jgi:hypothetical protein